MWKKRVLTLYHSALGSCLNQYKLEICCSRDKIALESVALNQQSHVCTVQLAHANKYTRTNACRNHLRMVSAMATPAAAAALFNGFLSCETSAMSSSILDIHKIEHIYPGAQTTVASHEALAVAVTASVAATASKSWKSSSSSTSNSTIIVIRRLSANNTQSFYEEFTLSLSHHIFAEERWLNENGARCCLNGSSLYTRHFQSYPIHHYSMQTLSPVFFSSLWQFSFHSLLLPFYIFILCNTAFAFAFGTETFVRFAFIETKDEGKEKNTIKNVRMHVWMCMYVWVCIVYDKATLKKWKEKRPVSSEIYFSQCTKTKND